MFVSPNPTVSDIFLTYAAIVGAVADLVAVVVLGMFHDKLPSHEDPGAMLLVASSLKDVVVLSCALQDPLLLVQRLAEKNVVVVRAICPVEVTV